MPTSSRTPEVVQSPSRRPRPTTHSNGALVSRGAGEVSSANRAEAAVRVDTGFVSGDEISVHYDPMIAKLIVKGRDRTEALRIMANALDRYQVVGPQTNIQFLKNLVRHPKFIAGRGGDGVHCQVRRVGAVR